MQLLKTETKVNEAVSAIENLPIGKDKKLTIFKILILSLPDSLIDHSIGISPSYDHAIEILYPPID